MGKVWQAEQPQMSNAEFWASFTASDELYTFQSCNFSLHSSTWLCEMILFLKDPIFRWLKRLEGPNLNWFIALLDQTTRKEHLRNWTTVKWISRAQFPSDFTVKIYFVGGLKKDQLICQKKIFYYNSVRYIQKDKLNDEVMTKIKWNENWQMIHACYIRPKLSSPSWWLNREL